MANTTITLGDFIAQQRGVLVHYIRSRISDIGARDAEDILQDVLAGIVSVEVESEISAVSSYLYRSIRNRITDLYRAKESSIVMGELDDEKEAGHFMADLFSDPHHALERQSLMDKIFACVDSLSSEQRAVWISTELEGRSFQELSVLWDEPIGTLLSRKSRANSILRRLLENEYAVINEIKNKEGTL